MPEITGMCAKKCLANKCPFSGGMSLLIASWWKLLPDCALMLLHWGWAGGGNQILSWEFKTVTDRQKESLQLIPCEGGKKFPDLLLLK